MFGIVEGILAAERDHALGVRPLGAAIRHELRERVFSRYGRTSFRLWEAASGCASVRNADAWRWIHEFVGSRSCVLFLDLADGAEMFHVPSGSSLDGLLANTYGFVFYVTDAEADFLICFNDHDFLMGWGGAREWLEGRR